jgi:transcriptional regulator with XRE-family HTH domain
MAVDISKHIGERIRRARELRGLTQSELAQALGKNPTTVSNYENGNRTIRAIELPELARILDVPITYFFESEGLLNERLAELIDSLQTQRALDEPLLRELVDLLSAYLQAVSEIQADLATALAEIDRLKDQLAAHPGLETADATPRLLTFTVEETSLKHLVEMLIQQQYIRLDPDAGGDTT